MDPFYRAHGFELQTEESGDVAALFKLRLDEVENSLEMMRNFTAKESETVNLGEVEERNVFQLCRKFYGRTFYVY